MFDFFDDCLIFNTFYGDPGITLTLEGGNNHAYADGDITYQKGTTGIFVVDYFDWPC